MIVRGKAFGTDFLGIFLSISGNRLMYSAGFPSKKLISTITEKLELEPVEVRSETPLIGIFMAGNGKGVLSGIPAEGATLLETRYTAVGNLVVANDKGAVISPVLEDRKGEIEKALGVRTEVMRVGNHDVIGSMVLVNNKGALVRPKASEEELDTIEKALKVHADYGTLAKSDFIGSLAVVSDRGAVLPYSALAPEIAQLLEVLEID